LVKYLELLIVIEEQGFWVLLEDIAQGILRREATHAFVML